MSASCLEAANNLPKCGDVESIMTHGDGFFAMSPSNSESGNESKSISDKKSLSIDVETASDISSKSIAQETKGSVGKLRFIPSPTIANGFLSPAIPILPADSSVPFVYAHSVRFPFPPPMFNVPFKYPAYYGGQHGMAGFDTPTPEKEEQPEAEASAPPFVPPETYHEIRKLVRKSMHRCKVCKNRFVEKDIYERHLRDKHPPQYEKYIEEQARTIEEQRLAELEQVRREEIKTGGFILPAREVEEAEALADPAEIKLPAELDVGGSYTVYDEDGLACKRKRAYVKKISPQCPFCDKRFRNDCSLKKHIAKKHPECINFTQCNKCYKAVKSSDEWESHECDLTYMCWSCRPIRNMCTKDRLEIHARKFHRGSESGFKCNECSRKFLTPRKLRKHKKMAHVVDRPFKCHFCEEYFPTDTQAALHERIHTGKLVFECNICDHKENRFLHLQEHQRREHGYACVICSERLVEWSELKLHTSEKHYGYLSVENEMHFTESPRVWIMFLGEIKLACVSGALTLRAPTRRSALGTRHRKVNEL
ncbi:hypothetical protein M514_05011 [Trichuris suis]|uniref:C2H2-type domain-containing protein n=1 Tax=Trichuris suis TaxID=68888 RepID=A0A085NNV0_9BILA|nr:hypothetical protein M514_05011 [Trichuris suis]